MGLRKFSLFTGAVGRITLKYSMSDYREIIILDDLVYILWINKLVRLCLSMFLRIIILTDRSVVNKEQSSFVCFPLVKTKRYFVLLYSLGLNDCGLKHFHDLRATGVTPLHLHVSVSFKERGTIQWTLLLFISMLKF